MIIFFVKKSLNESERHEKRKLVQQIIKLFLSVEIQSCEHIIIVILYCFIVLNNSFFPLWIIIEKPILTYHLY
jgi:hypothetical protein